MGCAAWHFAGAARQPDQGLRVELRRRFRCRRRQQSIRRDDMLWEVLAQFCDRAAETLPRRQAESRQRAAKIIQRLPPQHPIPPGRQRLRQGRGLGDGAADHQQLIGDGDCRTGSGKSREPLASPASRRLASPPSAAWWAVARCRWLDPGNVAPPGRNRRQTRSAGHAAAIAGRSAAPIGAPCFPARCSAWRRIMSTLQGRTADLERHRLPPYTDMVGGRATAARDGGHRFGESPETCPGPCRKPGPGLGLR